MIKFTAVEQVVTDEESQLLPLPPTAPPITSPFPLSLASGATYDLAAVSLNLAGDRDGVLLFAAVNWSATFATAVTLVPGWVDVTFQLLRNGTLIYQVTESAVQTPIGQQNLAVSFPGSTDFRAASLRYLDTAPTKACPGVLTYTLRATSIVFKDTTDIDNNTFPPTAAIGAVTLTAEEIEACRCRGPERR